MKTHFIISFLFLISINSSAQDTVWICNQGWPIPGKVDCSPWALIDFENTHNPIAIDSTTNYQWQIGTTSKFGYNSNSWGRSIMTDTLNPYPINYLSIFRITIVGNLYGDELTVSFIHKFDTDIGNDGGKIEIYDKFEKKWKNIIRNLNYNFNDFNLYTESDSIGALNNEPGFTGSSNGEEHVFFSCRAFPDAMIDTIDLRFVFASDSIDNNKDGWIIDDIWIGSPYEGISDKVGLVFNIFPNPFNDNIRIQNFNDLHPFDSFIEIIDINGNLVYSKSDYDGSKLNLSELNSGLYLLKIISGRNCFAHKILKK